MLDLLLKNSVTPNYRYIDRYIRFISYCKTKKFVGFCERHHVIPRSFGGSDTSENLVSLSPRHHYIAHVLLARATSSPKMIKALHRMMFSKTLHRDYKISSRLYEFLRNEHAKIVSNYSKNTVTARHIYTDEVKRIPSKLFECYKDILYVGLTRGRIDNEETKKLKSIAARKPRKKVKLDSRKRSIAASKYSYITPRGYCKTSYDLLKLYPTFTKSTLAVITNDFVISCKFASIHHEFKPHIGKTLAEIGFTKETNEQITLF